MASISSLFVFAVVSSLLLGASVDFVDGKVIARSSRQHDIDPSDFTCVQKLAFCAFPLMMLSQGQNMETAIRQEVLENGLNGVCVPARAVRDCITEQLRSGCEDEELPAEFLRAMDLVSEIIGFVCVTAFDSINADRACLFGGRLDQATNQNCGDLQPTGEICRLTDDMECAVQQYENVCHNPQLASQLRRFTTTLERKSGCDKSKVSMRWLHVMKILRAR